MKMIKQFFFILILVCGSAFIVFSFDKASTVPEALQPPELEQVAVRVYGVIEPRGREVIVSPPMTRHVVEIFVREGDYVEKGQKLCVLENSVETAQLRLAESRLLASDKAVEISRDEMNRAQELFSGRVDSEYRFTQARLQNELDVVNVASARREVELSRAQLEQTVLRSPVDGIVYKFDVRLGETLASGENSKIVIGGEGLWVRLFVESFWKDRIDPDSEYRVYDTETNEFIGNARFHKRMMYLGRRDFRTEDSRERFDTKFQEVVLTLEPARENIPIGLSVMAELQ